MKVGAARTTRDRPATPLARQLLALALPVALAAQAPPLALSGRRTCTVGRVAAADAPRIDGSLTDACWAAAPAIGELVMVEPWEGRVPTERTVVRLLHDERELYLALVCDHRDTGSVRATQRARDARLDPDDRVEIMFDPFENRRTAYFFQVGAAGSLGDAIVSQNGGRFEKPWDAIWRAEVLRTDAGWQAEIALPFRSIPRAHGAGSWGFNLRRIVRASNEEYQWANPTQSVPFFRVSEFGTMAGLGELSDGVGVDLMPYTTVEMARDRSAADPGWKSDPDAGGDVFYRVTPELTLAATVLTDFAETENDGRQINLDRFPLFFPEKRDFFLEGAGYFGFGAERFGEGSTLLPFFSRRIGLDADGAEIPLLGGIKLTGEAGPWELGMLTVVTDATATVPDERVLAVARAKYALGEQTTVGVIGTSGRPTAPGSNAVLGADFYHRCERFVGDLDLQLSANVVGSHTSGGGGDGESFAVEARSVGSEWELHAGTRWISAEFNPELGFVRRTGTRSWLADASFEPRLTEGGQVRNLVFEGAASFFESWAGSTQEVDLELEFAGVEFHSGDRVGVTAARRFDRVEQDFLLFDNSVTISAGDYWGTRYGVEFASSEGRALSSGASVTSGDFFDGRSTSYSLDVDWRTSALLILGARWRSDVVDLGPGRDFTTQIVEGQADLHWSPTLSVYNLGQFDNESQTLGWQTRLRWIYSPGCDLFAVAEFGWVRGDSFAPTNQAVTLKVVHTLRF
jgi:hypothetical protein